MHKIKYYCQNLETKPGSAQDEVLVGTVDKLATFWAPDSVVYRLFVQRRSSKRSQRGDDDASATLLKPD